MRSTRCVLSLLTLLAACSRPEPAPPAPRPAVVRTVAPAAAGELAVYAGEVRARHEAELAFRSGGKIVERRVDLGEAVRRGALLARLDAGDAELAASAGAAQVAAAEAELTLARAEHERALNLAARNFVAGSVVDSRRAQLQAAEARLRQARAQAGVSANQLGYTTLVADRDGVVTAVAAEVGQVVAAGQMVLRLADPGEREVLIHVPETRVAAVTAAQPALVRPWPAPERTLPATVREIAASADPVTRTFAVRVAVPQAGGLLPLGTTAAVAFPGPAGSAVTLPLPALIQRDGRTLVWVIGAGDRVELRPVEVAPYRDDAVRVTAGLAAGDRVVVVGAHALSAGMAVRPVAEQAPVALDARR